MTTVRLAVAISLAALVFAMISHGVNAKSGGGNINVTTIVRDYDSTGTQLLLMRSDDCNGSQEATYSGMLNAGVSSYIDTTGQWRFDLYGQKQGVRTLWLTPNDAINGSQPPGQPPGYYWKSVEIYTTCRDQNLNIVPLQNILTSSNNCSMGVDFNSGGTTYKLILSPQLPASGPTTGLATVTCNATGGNPAQCVTWTITPYSGGGSLTDVGDSYSYTGPPKSPWVFIGQYYNTFRVDVTNP